jgi:DNA polymerase-3 subunit gamma/tau
MSQALYRKWRPHLWEEVIGQDHVIQTLKNAVQSGREGHAYLFSGPRGTGKTTTARLLAKAVNCLSEDPKSRPCDKCEHCRAVNESRFMDLIEIDAASNTSVDDVRDLRDKINFLPSQGKYKVYIIDEVHMLSTAAFNALLKTLEEPPPHAIFILATTEVHKIPPTVLSRCQRHEFRRIPVNHIVVQLEKIVEKENFSISKETLVLIARQSTGSSRDAISLLDQLTSSGEEISLSTAQMVLGTSTNQNVIALVKSIQEHKATDGLQIIHQALDGGSDPRQFARQIVEYLRALLLIRMGNSEQVDATTEQKTLMKDQAQSFEPSALMGAIRLFNYAAIDSRNNWQPSLSLELAIVEAIHGPEQIGKPAPVKSTPLQPQSQSKQPAFSQQKSQPNLVKNVAGVSTKTDPKPETPTASIPTAEVKSPERKKADPGRLAEVMSSWDQIRVVIKKKRSQTEGLLNSCKLRTIKGENLLLGFASDLLKSKMETEENLGVTREAIFEVLGFEIPISVVVVNEKAQNAPEDLDISSDGIVGTAINEGGKIVHKE